MRTSPLSDLRPLGKGLGLLWHHPWQTLGLALLSVVLSFLGPVLQLWAGVSEDPFVSLVLALVGMIPLELYFLPRFILALDAAAIDHPQNPRDTWQATFEARWLNAFLAKVLLYLVVFGGSMCLLVPGILAFALFGWTPWRVLLRGEPLMIAARSSYALTARLWPRLLLPLTFLLGVYLLALLAALQIETRFIPDPVNAWVRLTHPAVWSIDFGAGLLNLWMSAAGLSLYHRLELYDPVPDPPAGE